MVLGSFEERTLQTKRAGQWRSAQWLRDKMEESREHGRLAACRTGRSYESSRGLREGSRVIARVMSGRRPAIKGVFSAMIEPDAVMSTACLWGTIALQP